MILSLVKYVRAQVERRKPVLPRAEVLAARPQRNPLVDWSREPRGEDETPVALLKIPRRKDRFGNTVAKVFRLPDFRKLELDEIGSDVWEMCDGANSVDALTKAVCAKYRLNRRQAETSVTAYLKMLAERRLILLRTDRQGGAAAVAKGGDARQGGGKTKATNVSRRQKRA